MSSPALMKAQRTILSLRNGTKNLRERVGETTEHFVTAGETMVSAFAFGFWEGAIDKPEHFELAGVPVPLLAGIGGHALAMLGVGRGMESHLCAFSNGALASHLNGLGRRTGQKWGAQRKAAPGAVQGELPPGRPGGIGVSERDLVNLAL